MWFVSWVHVVTKKDGSRRFQACKFCGVPVAVTEGSITFIYQGKQMTRKAEECVFFQKID